MTRFAGVVGLIWLMAGCSSSARQFGANTRAAGEAESGAGNSDGGSSGRSSASGGAPSRAGAASTSADAGAPAEAGATGEAGTTGDAGAQGSSTAGAGGMVGSPGGAATGGSMNSAAPTVVSITPANSEAGVLAGTPLKITFSEAMDLASVEAAVSVSTFASSELSLSWTSGGKVLTVAATGGWKYATGSDPALAALAYTVTIAATAKDAQGNALGSPFSSSFKTRRRITQTFVSTNAASYSDYGHAVGDGPQLCVNATDNVRLDMWTSTASGGIYYGFASFDVTALGAAGANNTIEAATFTATQTAPMGAFYSNHQVTAAKLAYQAIDNTVLSAPVSAELGVFCASAQTLMPSANVLTSFKADFEAGSKKHLFRLSPSLGGPDSTVAFFSCGGFNLAVTRLAL